MPTPLPTSRRRRRDGELTWRRVIDAAIATILDLGYYGASSNEIARRAGCTWGTIQHQFGSREALLLEVLNDRWHRLQERVAVDDIEGDTLEERLTAVLGVLASHYEQPEHLAQLQILLDLTANPNTTARTREAVAIHGDRLTKAWEPLFASALGPAADHHDLARYAFLVLRGYLTGNLIADRISDQPDDSVERELLIRGTAAAVRGEAARRGITLE